MEPIQDDIETVRAWAGANLQASAALDRLVAERDDLLKRWDEAVVAENLAVAERDRQEQRLEARLQVIGELQAERDRLIHWIGKLLEAWDASEHGNVENALEKLRKAMSSV